MPSVLTKVASENLRPRVVAGDDSRHLALCVSGLHCTKSYRLAEWRAGRVAGRKHTALLGAGRHHGTDCLAYPIRLRSVDKQLQDLGRHEQRKPHMTVATYPGADFDQISWGLLSPQNYENPTPQSRYHLVVVGAGPAGLINAIGAAGLGAKVALIERHRMGGDCLNVGCMPSGAAGLQQAQ